MPCTQKAKLYVGILSFHTGVQKRNSLRNNGEGSKKLPTIMDHVKGLNIPIHIEYEILKIFMEST